MGQIVTWNPETPQFGQFKWHVQIPHYLWDSQPLISGSQWGSSRVSQSAEPQETPAFWTTWIPASLGKKEPYKPMKYRGIYLSTSPGGNLPQNLWTYPTAWHTAYPTTPRTYAMCKSPWHTGPHGQVFGLVCYFPKGFGTFYISSWILWPHPKCQGTHGTPTNCFLSTQVLRCNSHCRNNIFNL